MKITSKLFFLYKHFALGLSQNKIGNLQIIASLHSTIISFLKPEAVAVFGNKIFLDPQDSLRLSIKQIHDPIQTNQIKKCVKPGSIVVDAGAHIGYYTLIFAKLVKGKGHVYAFEPSLENFKLLKKNVATNGYKNVTLINKALSDKKEVLNLYLSKTSDADHKTYDDKNSRKFVKVQATSLDIFFKKSTFPIDFVKIDVQGYEAKILSGMKNILAKNEGLTILTEFWPLGISKTGQRAEEFLKKLSIHNYKLFDINEYSKEIKQLNPNQLLKEYNVKNTKVTNLLCLK